jgi:hypothetical protein
VEQQHHPGPQGANDKWKTRTDPRRQSGLRSSVSQAPRVPRVTNGTPASGGEAEHGEVKGAALAGCLGWPV